jgi:hypothetical protein
MVELERGLNDEKFAIGKSTMRFRLICSASWVIEKMKPNKGIYTIGRELIAGVINYGATEKELGF